MVTSDYSKFGLGRLEKVDPRDHNYKIRATLDFRDVMAPLTATGYKYWWANGWWGDQGSTPHCVAYAWTHWLEDAPITHAPRTPGAPTIFNTTEIYQDAQKVDEWPGEAYAGTSVRAGAKILKSLGLISEYRWAFNLEDTIAALLNLGPVVLGCNWYSSMFNPDIDGFLNISGGVAGGHAFVLNGVNARRRIVRMKNSWGRDWGSKGYGWMEFDDLERLINESGEVCIATEIQGD